MAGRMARLGNKLFHVTGAKDVIGEVRDGAGVLKGLMMKA